MIYAGILAGGKGTRMGVTELPKQFLELKGKPIIIHTIEKFLTFSVIDKVVLGIHPDWISYMEDLIDKYLSAYSERIWIAAGGTDRNETIANVIAVIQDFQTIDDEDILITHDAVRPFVSCKTIQENINLISDHDAVDSVVESTDTIVESRDSRRVSAIPERKYLYQGQTPQTFRMNEFLKLYNKLSSSEKLVLTDACKIFVLNNKNVALAAGEYSNIKITTITDLKIAKAMLEE